MIFFSSSILVLIAFINFSMVGSNVNHVLILNTFIEIKVVTILFINLMLGFILFLLLNYSSFIYYSVGITMTYGYVVVYAISLVLALWVLWLSNSCVSLLSHFLPQGIEGLLKLFIPVLEIVGVLIRPMTLAIRLATNISCGHVVLLMFSYFASNVANYLVLSISLLLLGLYAIEFLVCLIQAYVFWSLLYIYVIEIEI